MSKQYQPRPAFGAIQRMDGSASRITPRSMHLYDLTGESVMQGEVVAVFHNRKDHLDYYQDMAIFRESQKRRDQKFADKQAIKAVGAALDEMIAAPTPKPKTKAKTKSMGVSSLEVALLANMTSEEKDRLILRLLKRK